LENPEIVVGDSLSIIGTKVLAFQFVELLKNESTYQSVSSVDAVHDMRVAIRRMRVAGNIFKKFYCAEPFKSYRKHLKILGSKLGVVRDYDVFFEGLNLNELEVRFSDNTTWGELLKTLEYKHAVAREGMRVFFKSNDFKNFTEGYSLFLGNPNYFSDQADSQSSSVKEFIADVFISRMENLFSHNEKTDDITLEQFHQIRIDAKKLRYSLEFFGCVVGNGVNAAIFHLKDLQDLLGEMNDAVVAIKIIRGVGLEICDNENDFDDNVVDFLLNSKEERLDELIARFPEIWEEFLKPDFRDNLISAVEGVVWEK
jgi:CHAD domain-containing protein